LALLFFRDILLLGVAECPNFIAPDALGQQVANMVVMVCLAGRADFRQQLDDRVLCNAVNADG
jgi:hypothetical protein